MTDYDDLNLRTSLMHFEDYREKLEEYCQELTYEIVNWMDDLKHPEYPFDLIGNLSLKISDNVRALAVTVLIVKGACGDRFYYDLRRSGLARKIYLLRCREERHFEDHHRASGHYEPLLDTVATGDFRLAQRIAELSPRKWRKGHEYEDDYCYAQVIHRLVQDTSHEQEILSLLGQLEACLENRSRARLAICRALAIRDQVAFDKAFEALLNEREAEITKDNESDQKEQDQIYVEDVFFAAQQQVFVEGLAVLRLAETRGLITRPNYRYCPSLARVPMKSSFPEE